MTKKIISLVLVLATLFAMSSIAFTADAAKVSAPTKNTQGVSYYNVNRSGRTVCGTYMRCNNGRKIYIPSGKRVFVIYKCVGSSWYCEAYCKYSGNYGYINWGHIKLDNVYLNSRGNKLSAK